jgi:serine-type D-Ala-D-Ala carboxypeptidase/endopeptidase
MLNRRTVLTAAGAAILIGTPAHAEDDLKSLVDSRVPQDGPLMAIGAFRGREQYAVHGDAIFQIGSITKTFTGLALAIQRRLDDPLSTRLPNLKGITLAHLATHTSGLDRLPPGLLEDSDLDPLDPYANFSEADLQAAMEKTVLLTKPGTTYLYSNYGAGLLGRKLARDYETLIRGQVAIPLGLRDIAITLTESQKRRKVQGYDATGAATPDWHLPTLAGAGALYGSVDDLLRYLRAHLGEAPGWLKPALELVQRTRFTVSPATKVALGWHTLILPTSGKMAIWHNGGTGGFATFAAFCPSRKTGVAVLASKADVDATTIGAELLDTL